MVLSDISVRRPVFAGVISLILVILGVLAAAALPVREFPDVDPPVVSISTTYRGASAEIIERQITQTIEDEVSGIAGVQKLTSNEPGRALQHHHRVLPGPGSGRRRQRRARAGVPDPAAAAGGRGHAARSPSRTRAWTPRCTSALESQTRSLMELTDFAERNLVDRLSRDRRRRPGPDGRRPEPAMRIWLNRDALAARGLTVQDVEDTLRRENVELPAGRIESRQREFSLRTETGLDTPEDSQALVVGRGPDNYLIRLGEVADVRVEAGGFPLLLPLRTACRASAWG